MVDTTRTLELGFDSLCWNWQIANGVASLEQVAEQGLQLGAKWLRLHANHLPPGAPHGYMVELGHQVRERGASMVWSGDGFGCARNGESHGIAHVLGEVERAISAGASIVQFYASWFRSDPEIIENGVERELDYVRSVLGSVAEAVNDTDVVVTIENHSNLTSAELANIIRDVHSPNVRAYLDVANAVAVSEPVIEAVRNLAPLAHAIDVKDVDVSTRWASNRWHRLGFDVRYVWPGKGILPWRDIWTELDNALGLARVPLIIEGLNEARNPHAEALDSIQYLRGLDRPTLGLAS